MGKFLTTNTTNPNPPFDSHGARYSQNAPSIGERRKANPTEFDRNFEIAKLTKTKTKFIAKEALSALKEGLIATGLGIALLICSPVLALYALSYLGSKASNKVAKMWNARFPSNPSVPKPEFSGSPNFRDIGDKRAQALAKQQEGY